MSLQSLADNAILGILIGVGLAFPILSLSTMNVVIGFLATLSICCTTVCVIGVIPLAGWKLGVRIKTDNSNCDSIKIIGYWQISKF